MDNMEEVVSEMIGGDSALAAKIEEQRQRPAALVDVPDDFTGPRWNPSLTVRCTSLLLLFTVLLLLLLLQIFSVAFRLSSLFACVCCDDGVMCVG